nr:PREDICTED: endoplasmic reticulum resident protein 27 [Apteryx mantelli mantelli]
MVKRREAGIMGTSIFTCLFIILLTGGSPAGCADDRGSASHGMAGSAKKPVLLNNTEDVKAFISGAEVAVIGFFQAGRHGRGTPGPPHPGPRTRLFKSGRPERRWGCLASHPAAGVKAEGLAALLLVRRALQIPHVAHGTQRSRHGGTISSVADDDRRDLDITDGKEVNAEKMIRFIRMNELRLVTEYNPVTAIGLLHSSVQFHLLLITDKRSPEHPERMRRFREAAELFQGKILFVLVDSNVKGNERVVSFFKLKKSQLPALAIFHTPDEERDVLPLDEVSIEHVQDFCNVFLQRKQKKEDEPDEPEEKAVNEEL